MVKYDKLWEIIAEKNISTYKLREEAGIGGRTIYKLQHNEYVALRTLEKLCCYLQCDINELLDFDFE